MGVAGNKLCNARAECGTRCRHHILLGAARIGDHCVGGKMGRQCAQYALHLPYRRGDQHEIRADYRTADIGGNLIDNAKLGSLVQIARIASHADDALHARGAL